MVGITQQFDFPKQRVPSSEKRKREWYANSCDWVIAQALACNDNKEKEELLNALNENISNEHYKKTLNPYNSTNAKFTNFPATLRNYDMMKGTIRRYVSEYIKNPHEFIVGANNPEVVMARDIKIRESVMELVQQKLQEIVQQKMQEMQQDPEAVEQLGANFNPLEGVDVENIVKEVSEEFIDDISEQGQNLLNVIKDITDDALLYAAAYSDYVSFGECYTYTEIVGEKIIKKVIKPIDMYPVPNDNLFVEDYDMCVCRRKMTKQQILDEWGDELDNEDKNFFETYYGRATANSIENFNFSRYNNAYPDRCSKFSANERKLFGDTAIYLRDLNAEIYDVWHAVWRGDIRRAIVTFVNEAQMIDRRVENDDYVLNPELGDISIEYVYEPQVYESIRIGTRQTGIYPIKAKPISYNRGGKLPYNGMYELLPGLGKFSIVKTMLPYQLFYNIVAYHREMAIAKNKLAILMIAKSLLGKKPEDTIYRMLADNVLYIDDSEDQGMLRAQQVRVLTADISNYIKSLSELLADIENAAKLQVDMTPQRYGEIANSAGKGVTDEAVMRGSMGTVVIEFKMDAMRERDYARDLDYTKLAWIDGLETSYRDGDGNLKYITLDVNKHIFADYIVKCKNSIKEKEKLDQIKQFAFNMGQNGDSMSAIAAITGDNIANIKKLIKRFTEDARAHEEQMKQMDQQLEQMKQEFELEKIHAKGEEDRLTKQIEAEADIQIELLKADANMISFDNGIDQETKQAGVDRLNEARIQHDRDKLNLERQKVQLDTFNKFQDRAVKLKDIETKLQIAKTNKNRYDK